ncbi:MAG: hypothetical protein JJU06_21805 [Ectothiorhodospiraceae bacterium]|nr:hypothetical protein [Ectothiorhodospiraceae bacterium]
MPQHTSHRPTARVAPLVLLVLLVSLLGTTSLASPVSSLPDGEPTTESTAYKHDSSETPVCHHEGVHRTVPGLVANKRGVDTPSSGDSSAALPMHGQAPNLTPISAPEAPESFSTHTDVGLPIYLLTRRLRV